MIFTYLKYDICISVDYLIGYFMNTFLFIFSFYFYFSPFLSLSGVD